MATDETMRMVLGMLSEAYPGRMKLGENTLPVWRRLLDDVPDEVLMAAVVHHTTHNKWPPSIAELRQCSFEAVQGPQLTAGEAWDRVIRCAGKYGWPRPDMAEREMGPVIWRCVMALGGWQYVCGSEDAMADRAHFMKIYDQIHERERQQAMMLPEVREVFGRLRMGGKAGYLGEGKDDEA